MASTTLSSTPLRDLPDRELRGRRHRLAERVCALSIRLHLIDDELLRREREKERDAILRRSGEEAVPA